MNLQFLSNPTKKSGPGRKKASTKKKTRKKSKKKLAVRKKKRKIKAVKTKSKEGAMAKKKRKKATRKKATRKKATRRKKVARKKATKKKVARKKPVRRKRKKVARKKVARKKVARKKTTRRKTKRRNPRNPTKATVKAVNRKTGKRVAQKTKTYNNSKEVAEAMYILEALKQKRKMTKDKARKAAIGARIKQVQTALKALRSSRKKGKEEIKMIRQTIRLAMPEAKIKNTDYKYMALKGNKRKALNKGKNMVKRKKRRKSRKRKNPIVKISNPSARQLTGHSMNQLGYLAAAGVSVDLVGTLAMKVPGVSTLKAKVGEAAPQLQAASGSIITLLLAMGSNVALAKYGRGKAAMHLSEYSKALVAASVVKIASAFSGTLTQAVGMAGVNYTPLSGVRYTPLSGGPTPQLGYKGEGLFSADFGKGFDVSDYGGGGGYTDYRRFSKADFGKYAHPQMGGVDFTPNSQLHGDDSPEPVLDQSSMMGMC